MKVFKKKLNKKIKLTSIFEILQITKRKFFQLLERHEKALIIFLFSAEEKAIRKINQKVLC